MNGGIFERLALFVEKDTLELLGREFESGLELFSDAFRVLESTLVTCCKFFCLWRNQRGDDEGGDFSTCFRFLSTSLTRVDNSSLISLRRWAKRNLFSAIIS